MTQYKYYEIFKNIQGSKYSSGETNDDTKAKQAHNDKTLKTSFCLVEMPRSLTVLGISD